MFYKSDIKNEGDMDQLKTQFANEVSKQFLETVALKGKTILDVGCGASVSLPKYLHERGALYQLVDHQKAMVDEMRSQLLENNLPVNLSIGDINNLQMPSNSIDYVHERLVLMHVEDKKRKYAVRRCILLAKEKVFFVGIDWSTFKWNKEDSYLTDFYRLYNEFMEKQGSDLSFGGKLKTLIDEEYEDDKIVKNVTETLYKREYGNHSNIIVSVCNSLIGQILQVSGNMNLVEELSEISKTAVEKGAWVTPAVMNVVCVENFERAIYPPSDYRPSDRKSYLGGGKWPDHKW